MNNAKISTKKLNLYYGANHALKDVDMDITANAITAFIGPSAVSYTHLTLPTILLV